MESARVYGILAPEANKVVLFRRGPSKLTLQLVWDLETDEIIPGQWIKGTVYVERCDVSPDGRYLVAAIANYGKIRQHERQLEYWTAISRPPYFTALAIWGSYGSYEGGGLWKSRTEVLLNNFIGCWEEKLAVKPPVKAHHMHSPDTRGPDLAVQLMLKRGWKVKKSLEAVFWERNGEDRRQAALDLGFDPAIIAGYPSRGRKLTQTSWSRTFKEGSMKSSDFGETTISQILDSSGRVVREWTTLSDHHFWLEADHKGWPVFSQDGCLYRWTNFPHGEPALVADLNHYTFEPVAPPAWATKW